MNQRLRLRQTWNRTYETDRCNACPHVDARRVYAAGPGARPMDHQQICASASAGRGVHRSHREQPPLPDWREQGRQPSMAARRSRIRPGSRQVDREEAGAVFRRSHGSRFGRRQGVHVRRAGRSGDQTASQHGVGIRPRNRRVAAARADADRTHCRCRG